MHNSVADLFFASIVMVAAATANAGLAAAADGYRARAPVVYAPSGATIVVVGNQFYTPGNPRCFLKRDIIVVSGREVMVYRRICD
jgi:hypothetical protein